MLLVSLAHKNISLLVTCSVQLLFSILHYICIPTVHLVKLHNPNDGIIMLSFVADHIGAELEENLGAIEEVTAYIKIVRSYALLSLRFLKSLSVIGGERLYDGQ